MRDRVTAIGGGAQRPVIVLDAVGRTYTSPVEEVVAVRAVTLSVAPGEFVCLMGPSGCGKSTLLNLVAGLDLPSAGRIETAGAEVSALGESARAAHRLATMGYVFQEHRLIAELTAGENVALPLEVGGASARHARDAADEALAAVGLAELAGRYPEELSGGQRQRVGIARALVGGRRIILADEATGALDSATSRSIYELLANLARGGATILAATHDPEAEQWATRVVFMRDGAVVSDRDGARKFGVTT